MNVWLVVALVVSLAAAVGAGEALQARGSIPDAHGGFRLDLLAGSALTLAVIMCSFMLATTYTSYDGAGIDASREAASVSAEYQAATLLPNESDATTVSQDVLCYARAVSSDEWPHLGHRATSSHRVEQWRVRLQSDLRRIGMTRNSPAVQDLRTADQDRALTHQVRLTTAVNRTPIYLFVLLIAVAAAAIFFVTAFTVHTIPRRLRVAVVGVLTLLLAGTLAVIIDLNHPYNGVSRLGPEAMNRATAMNAANYSDLFHGARITACDAEGRPTV